MVKIKVTQVKSSIKKRIGIFGGAFDPIHHGHIIPTQEIIKAHKLDKVHFVPTNIPTSSKKIIASSRKDFIREFSEATKV